MGSILVTGGAGFIGSHLTELLAHHGNEVYIIDDLSTGQRQNVPLNHPNIHFYEGDVRDKSLLDAIIPKVDLVFNLAALVGCKRVMNAPIEIINRNIDGLRSVVESCALAKVPLVSFSSSAVYPHQHSQISDIDVETVQAHPFGLHPMSMYAETKMLGELICEAYHLTHDLKYFIVRPFNLIGPRQTGVYGMVVPTFVRCAIEGRPLPIYGDGHQTRTFTDVRQAVDILWQLVNKPDIFGKIVNLATSTYDCPIIDLAEKVGKVVGKKISLQFIPYEKAYGPNYVDIQARRPSLDYLRELCGSWEPIPLEDTIAAIYDYEVKRIAQNA